MLWPNAARPSAVGPTRSDRSRARAPEVADVRPPRHPLRAAAVGMAVLAGALTACTSAHTVQSVEPTTDSAVTSAPAPTEPVSSNARWPASIANRKIFDQNGNVYLMRS